MWKEFFKAFPEYCNNFQRIELKNDQVIIQGYSLWHKGSKKDHVIWVAKIKDDLVAEWRIYEDTDENRKRFSLNF